MNRSARVSLALVSSLVMLACSGGEDSPGSSNSVGGVGGGGGGGGGGSAAGSLPCGVADVLVTNCQSCHGSSPKFGAPMPLVTHADLVAPSFSDPSRPVYELVGARIHDDAKPMPQPPNERLGEPDTKTLDDWIAAGAAPAQGNCGGGGAGGGGGTGGGSVLSCTPDIHLESASAWEMPENTEDIYVCYGVDVTPPQDSQIIAFSPRIDNTTIVHHVLLFQTDSAVSPTPTPCAGGGGLGWRIVSVWAPGGQPFELPPQAGIPLTGTTHYAVQVHYSNLMHLAGQTDRSGFDLCSTTDLRPNEADILAFGTTQISIPPAGSLDVTCDFAVPAQLPPTHVIGAMPHMHKLGRTISTVNLPGGTGAPVDLGTREVWSFDSQYWEPLDTIVSGGDTVRTRCAWDNPGSQTVTFGEDTSDEMCYSFAIYYPRITGPTWNWALPSALSSCSPTP